MKIIAITILLFSILTVGYPTKETVFKVYQPILVEEGLQESISTYVKFIGHPLASQLVLTCAENHIETQNGIENRNIANLYSLNIDIVYNEFGLPIFGDTVKVKLILPSNFSNIKLHQGLDLKDLISITIRCAQKNAASFESIKYMKLELVGEPKYYEFSKLYTL